MQSMEGESSVQERETCISVRGREGIVQRKRTHNAAPEKIKENN